MIAEHYITSSCKIDQETVFKNEVPVFKDRENQFPGLLLAIYQHFQLNYPKFYKMDNLSKLGWLAAEVLLKDSFTGHHYQPEQIGLILANRNSSLDVDIKYFDSLKEFASPSLFVYTLPNIVIGEICIRNNFKGEHAFFIQDTFEAQFIETQVSYLLESNHLEACICGWVDVLGTDYKAVLFLVEKRKSDHALVFSAENMVSIFTTVKI